METEIYTNPGMIFLAIIVIIAIVFGLVKYNEYLKRVRKEFEDYLIQNNYAPFSPPSIYTKIFLNWVKQANYSNNITDALANDKYKAFTYLSVEQTITTDKDGNTHVYYTNYYYSIMSQKAKYVNPDFTLNAQRDTFLSRKPKGEYGFETESLEMNKLFNLYSNDKQEATVLLSPTKLEKLIATQKPFFITGQEMFVVCSGALNKNNFEALSATLEAYDFS